MNRSPLRPAVAPFLILALALLAAVLPAQAGLNRWTPFGPPFTYDRMLAVAVVRPGLTAGLLAAPESGGVYRSDDNGRHWRQLYVPASAIESLAVDPTDASVVYLGDGTALLRGPGSRSTPASPALDIPTYTRW